MTYLSNQKGQSLLELLVSMLILVLVLTATITLIVTSINAGRESRNKLIAASLAREGIETVRNIRDSNWVDPTSPAWTSGLVGNNPVIPFVDLSTPTVLYYSTDPQYQTRLFLYNDVYLQGSGVPGLGTEFYRLMYFNDICLNDTTGDEQIVDKDSTDDCTSLGSGTDYEKVGLRVVSEVHWPSETSNKKVIIEDRLYDWQVL
jgi:type II secretory pathway pseudopilin PulG